MTATAESLAELNDAQQDRVGEILLRLVEVCSDGEAGYQEAAQHARAPEMRALFESFAAQRGEFTRDLKNLMACMGRPLARGVGSRAAQFHRFWIDLRSAVDKGGSVTLISECERGEQSALASYETALKGDLPASVQETLLDHVIELRRIHDALDKMRQPW